MAEKLPEDPKKVDKFTEVKSVIDRILKFVDDNKENIKSNPKLYIGAALVFAGIVAVISFMG